MTCIVVYNQRVGTTDYIPGDKIDVDHLISLELLNEPLVKGLRHRGELADATKETMAVALARRPKGSAWPPRGWTEAELEAAGYLPAEPAPAAPAEPEKPAKAKKVRAAPQVIDRVELTDDKIAVGPYFLQPTKRGNFVFFHAADAEGRVLQASMFRNEANGRAFLEELAAKAAADTQAGDKESPDERELQSGPADAPGSGSSEDR